MGERRESARLGLRSFDVRPFPKRLGSLRRGLPPVARFVRDNTSPSLEPRAEMTRLRALLSAEIELSLGS